MVYEDNFVVFLQSLRLTKIFLDKSHFFRFHFCQKSSFRHQTSDRQNSYSKWGTLTRKTQACSGLLGKFLICEWTSVIWKNQKESALVSGAGRNLRNNLYSHVFSISASLKSDCPSPSPQLLGTSGSFWVECPLKIYNGRQISERTLWAGPSNLNNV